MRVIKRLISVVGVSWYFLAATAGSSSPSLQQVGPFGTAAQCVAVAKAMSAAGDVNVMGALCYGSNGETASTN